MPSEPGNRKIGEEQTRAAAWKKKKKKSQVFWQRYGKDGLVVKRALIAKTGKRKDLVIIPVIVSLILCSDRRPGFPSSRVYQRRTMFETMFVPTAGDTVNKLLFCSLVCELRVLLSKLSDLFEIVFLFVGTRTVMSLSLHRCHLHEITVVVDIWIEDFRGLIVKSPKKRGRKVQIHHKAISC